MLKKVKRNVKNFCKKVVRGNIGLNILFSGNHFDSYAEESMRVLKRKTGIPFYFGKYCKLDDLNEYPIFDISDVAIIMQGVIDYKDDFTLNTLKIYRHLYPKIEIVLSTWKGMVNEGFKKECIAINVTIIESNEPSDVGAFHINCQLKSTIVGVRFIKENPAIKYVLKTRTDQRLYRYDFLNYFINVHRQYKVDDYFGLNGRIIYLGTSFLYVPFSICDFLSFGYIDDIERLYSIPYESSLDNKFFDDELGNRKKLSDEYQYEKYSISQIDKHDLNAAYELTRYISIPEIYITKTFIEMLSGKKLKDDFEVFYDYWEFVGKATIIIDDRDLLFYWPKYDVRGLQDSNLFMHKCGLDHIRWVDIFVNRRWEDR